MRRAFTLIELLAVIGIVGMLGVAAAASYGALVTGMRDRSACAAATAVLREACERARIDRLPTVVYCYNVCLKESKADDPGRVVGLMTAIRRVGRITQVKGRYLFDEFADLDQSYKKMDSEAELREMDGFRLFKYNDESSVQSRMQYSVVANAVYCKDYGSKPGDEGELTIFSGGINNRTNFFTSAFYNLGSSDREPSAWKVGDGYAAEFAELQLPEGYVFGQQLPTKSGAVSEVKAIRFDPDSSSSETVEIWMTRPNAQGVPKPARKAGQAYADDRKKV